MRIWRHNRAVRYISLVVIAVFTVLSFCVVVDVAYHHYNLKSRVGVFLRGAHFQSDLEVRRGIFSLLQERGIECPEDQITVTRFQDTIRVSLQYRYPLGFPLPKGRFILQSVTATATLERAL